MVKLSSEFEVVCPCCGATQTVDPHLKRVVGQREPAREDSPELDQAQRILAKEAERLETLFQQSVRDEQTRGDALSKRFEEALKQTQQEPIVRPDRDFDLD
jgi:PAS domain-containing protein